LFDKQGVEAVADPVEPMGDLEPVLSAGVAEALMPVPVAGATSTGVDEFVAAYRVTLPAVFGYVLRSTGGDRPLAEDVCADTYLDALAAWREGRAPNLSAAWFIGIARHKMIDAFRRAEREQRKLALVHAGEPDEAPDDFATVDRADLLACARRLPPLQRAVLALRYGDDLAVAEIARRLDRDTGAIDSLLRRARAGLRRMLAGEEDHDG
jgi:RNA polymerase sigma-70 factor (ECF subfamily)